MADWTNFYIAGAGAAAALVGLFIVAISVNIEQIVKFRALPPRAAATIATLLLALLTCMSGLMADQGPRWFGSVVLVLAVGAWVTRIHSTRVLYVDRASRSRASLIGEAISGQSQTIPFIVGAVLVLGDQPAGLNWMGFGVLAVFALSMITVWVLLIEIRR